MFSLLQTFIIGISFTIINSIQYRDVARIQILGEAIAIDTITYRNMWHQNYR